jgi:hypothetical protein
VVGGRGRRGQSHRDRRARSGGRRGDAREEGAREEDGLRGGGGIILSGDNFLLSQIITVSLIHSGQKSFCFDSGSS